MLRETRYYRITEYMKEAKTATYREIAEAVDFSEGTIRKDIVELEKRGILNVVRGGATLAKTDQSRDIISSRLNRNLEKKENLVKALGDYVENGFALALNGGATQIPVMNYLIKNYRKLTIITNNLYAAEIARHQKYYDVIIPGGIYDGEEHTITGHIAQRDLESYNADVAIIAINAISLEKGITDFRLEERGIVRSMMKNAKRKIIVVDDTKFDHIAYVQICDLSEIDTIITNNGIDSRVLRKYRNAGVDIVIGPDE